MPEHEHVDEHGERLDRELRHREIRRAEDQERHGHAVADDAEREHRRHGGLGERRRDRAGDDDDDDRDARGWCTLVRGTADAEARARMTSAVPPISGRRDDNHHHVRPQRRTVQRRSDRAADRVQRRERAVVELLGAVRAVATLAPRIASRATYARPTPSEGQAR